MLRPLMPVRSVKAGSSQLLINALTGHVKCYFTCAVTSVPNSCAQAAVIFVGEEVVLQPAYQNKEASGPLLPTRSAFEDTVAGWQLRDAGHFGSTKKEPGTLSNPSNSS